MDHLHDHGTQPQEIITEEVPNVRLFPGNYMRNMLWLLIVAVPALSLASKKTYREAQAKMGSPFSITVVHEDEKTARAAIQTAWKEIDRLERIISSWQEDSQTSSVNREAGIKPVVVSRELFNLVRRSLKVSALTDGAFDITFASAGRYWDFRSNQLPNPEDVARAVAAIDYRKIQLNAATQSIFLQDRSTRIGFGGIGKGYAANRALHTLKEAGIQHAIVNAGGDLVATGRQANGQPWDIVIAHPRQEANILARLNLTEQAVVTSGDYERYFMLDGKRYSHIIDPRTGYPVSGMMSVTVICPDAELADALATSVFVMGAHEGLALVNKMKQVECIIVTANEEVFYSNHIKPSGQPKN